MNEQIFPCEVVNPGASLKKPILLIIFNALLGFGILVFLYRDIGLDTLLSISKLALTVGTALFLILLAYFKASELWENRNLAEPKSVSLVLTDTALEHRFGLTKLVIPYEAVEKIVEPSKNGESVTLILSDGIPIELPMPQSERDFLMHIKSKLPHAL